MKVKYKEICHQCGYLHPDLHRYYKCHAGSCPAKNEVEKTVQNDPLMWCKIHHRKTDEGCCCPECEGRV